MSDTAALNQTPRLLRIASPLGPDALVARRLMVRESIGGLFKIEAEVLSQDPAIDPETIVGKPVTCSVETELRSVRHFHGIANAFVRIGEDVRGHTTYRLEAAPRLWNLGRRVNCRIFQKKKVTDIIQTLVNEAEAAPLQFGAETEKPPREYCTQFNESDLDFAMRLMEEHGWALYFQMEQSQHTAHVVGANAGFPLIANTQTVRPHADIIGSLTRWEPRSRLPPGSVRAWDHDGLQKTANLQTQATSVVHTAHSGGAELFRWPGGQTVRPGADPAKLLMEGAEAGADLVSAAGNDPSIFAGGRLKVKSGLEGTLATWLVAEVVHQAFDETHLDAGGGSGYGNQLVLMPADRPWRPPAPRPRPFMAGVQYAVVTGPSGEEIHCDEYGRIRVLFPWDRLGANDDTSSCWVRVVQASGGAWGGNWYLPRIGDQVIVAYVDADPDRPIVIGTVYGEGFKPPFPLPAKKTQTGYKTRSSKQGGASNFNQIMFDDDKGSELVDMQAEKDLKLLVKNDRTVRVGHDHTENIGNHRTATIEKGDETLTVQTGNMATEVSKGNQDTVVKMGNQSNEVSMGNQTNTVKMGNITEKVNLGKIDIEAMQSITLKVGANSIKIDQTGVTIKGIVVKIEGTAMLDTKAPMSQHSGDGMMIIKGGLVMIN